MKNWKTTLFGGLTAAGAGLAQSDIPTLKIIGQILTIAGPVLLGIAATDSNSTGGKIAQ